MFNLGLVTYSNESKIKILKVSKKIIKKYGAVSEEVCKAMVINISKIGKTKGKWTKKYDSLIIGRIKFKNLSGYFNYNTYYVVKDFAQFTSLSNHIIDKNSLKVNWDPAYDDYQIK